MQLPRSLSFVNGGMNGGWGAAGLPELAWLGSGGLVLGCESRKSTTVMVASLGDAIRRELFKRSAHYFDPLAQCPSQGAGFNPPQP